MVDPTHLEQIKCLQDVVWTTLLAGMRDTLQTEVSRRLEHTDEFPGWVADFCAV